MAGTNQVQEKPAVLIYHTPEPPPQETLNQILWGMEEEGVPARVLEVASDSALDLGQRAANQSQLGVGIGLDTGGQVVLHYYRLPPEKPLFTLTSQDGAGGIYRQLGCNAARLVKGIPFKSMEPESDLPQVGQPEEMDLEQLVRKVVEVVIKVLSEENHKQGGEVVAK